MPSRPVKTRGLVHPPAFQPHEALGARHQSGKFQAGKGHTVRLQQRQRRSHHQRRRGRQSRRNRHIAHHHALDPAGERHSMLQQPPRRRPHIVRPVALRRRLDGTFQLKRKGVETRQGTVETHDRVVRDGEFDAHVPVDRDGEDREAVVVGVFADQVDAAGRGHPPLGTGRAARSGRPSRRRAARVRRPSGGTAPPHALGPPSSPSSNPATQSAIAQLRQQPEQPNPGPRRNRQRRPPLPAPCPYSRYPVPKSAA